jgi:5-hydroxyisourate hydrolase
MIGITAHVLDTALGVPARGLRLTLSAVASAGEWETLGVQDTNDDGRTPDLLGGRPLEARTYKLTFETAAYFKASGRSTFYPYVEVVFRVQAPEQHHHVPLLLSPYGYSTYRGS